MRMTVFICCQTDKVLYVLLVVLFTSFLPELRTAAKGEVKPTNIKSNFPILLKILRFNKRFVFYFIFSFTCCFCFYTFCSGNAILQKNLFNMILTFFLFYFCTKTCIVLQIYLLSVQLWQNKPKKKTYRDMKVIQLQFLMLEILSQIKLKTFRLCLLKRKRKSIR